MLQVYVVDAGVLFSTWVMNIEDANLMTTSNILTEIRNRPSQTRADTLMHLDRLHTADPLPEHVYRVGTAATHSGDVSDLSSNDIELVALALMLEEQGGRSVVLVSKDMAVLNAASHLRLNVHDPSGRFGQKITWAMNCPACHFQSKTLTRETECPVCGTEMRRRPLKKLRIRERF